MDKGDPFIAGYYSFAASCDFPNTAATTPWGQFAVSPRTGDVVQLETCKWFRYPDLRVLQKQIVAQTHASEQAEVRYRKNTGCTNWD